MQTETAVLLGCVAAAKQLNRSPSQMRYLADTKALPSFRDSANRRLFLRSDLEEYKRRELVKKNGGKLKLRLRLKEK